MIRNLDWNKTRFEAGDLGSEIGSIHLRLGSEFGDIRFRSRCLAIRGGAAGGAGVSDSAFARDAGVFQLAGGGKGVEAVEFMLGT